MTDFLAFEDLVAMLVIPGPLLLIAEALVRFSDHLKLFGRVPVLVLVRMPDHGLFVVGLQ